MNSVDQLKVLKRSRLYIDAMAQGVNPLTGEIVQNEVINQDRISRCFEYVSEIITKEIKRQERAILKREGKNKKKPYLTREEATNIELSDIPVPISRFTQKINEAIKRSDVKPFAATEITGLLVDGGYLSTIEGTNRKCINTKSSELDITSVERRTDYGGNYTIILYGMKAQKYILSIITRNEE